MKRIAQFEVDVVARELQTALEKQAICAYRGSIIGDIGTSHMVFGKLFVCERIWEAIIGVVYHRAYEYETG